jgi:hypothetical protein
MSGAGIGIRRFGAVPIPEPDATSITFSGVGIAPDVPVRLLSVLELILMVSGV